MGNRAVAEALLQSRASLSEGRRTRSNEKSEAEGGCGVIGISSSAQIPARHLLQALTQMRNRGNNKGGGIAAVGLVPEQFGVSPDVLENDYLLGVAYLDAEARESVEEKYIRSTFHIDHIHEVPTVADMSEIPALEVRPPDVVLYFVRPKDEMLEAFRHQDGLSEAPREKAEAELVYQNSYRLNRQYYAGETSQAFVLSHGKNLLVLKMVGYGDDVIRYYRLEDVAAHVWIGHHRYPTKGRVWHPGGAHPFVGLHEALVHNGDFANYASICEYLAQRNIYPLFQTDTEVSALVFDLHDRIYDYPLEYVIESMAPTTERDFSMLPDEKRRIYEMIQRMHIHGSPDGPWFFLIAQSKNNAYRLIGITDTSMLRPQVFALQSGEETIGFAASEKQGIDAALESLAAEDSRFWTRADMYWNARGGSHTDGGAFIFDVVQNGAGRKLVCRDKFGKEISVKGGEATALTNRERVSAVPYEKDSTALALYEWAVEQMRTWDLSELDSFLHNVATSAVGEGSSGRAEELLTLLMDRRYDSGGLRRSVVLSRVDRAFGELMTSIRENTPGGYLWVTADSDAPDATDEATLILDATDFPQEGPDSLAMKIIELYRRGFQTFTIINTRGHRFIGNGLGVENDDLRIDVYGSSGDYLGSGIDGAEIVVHGNAQDQLAQIMKWGRLVIYGDVGQTFMYGAKGGEAYILGNAAGRPLINGVGRPRVVINGTCLDYLGESFMAGDPLNGGGFVVLNGITFDSSGEIIDLDEPYPGGNLFSLASGGAIYVRDPHRKVSDDQLNGGESATLTDKDWEVILPHLEYNEEIFDIPLTRLLTVDGEVRKPADVYRKIQPTRHHALQAEEAWVTGENGEQ